MRLTRTLPYYVSDGSGRWFDRFVSLDKSAHMRGYGCITFFRPLKLTFLVFVIPWSLLRKKHLFRAHFKPRGGSECSSATRFRTKLRQISRLARPLGEQKVWLAKFWYFCSCVYSDESNWIFQDCIFVLLVRNEVLGYSVLYVHGRFNMTRG